MKNDIITKAAEITTAAELKKLIIANAITTGNTHAFHDLFSRLKEASVVREDEMVNLVLEKVSYLLPDERISTSPKFIAAAELVDKYPLEDNLIPAVFLEETAKEAVARGKFAYAEDAYKLLGIKNEIVALYFQTGEQLLREDKPKHAAIAFLAAASIDQPLGINFQYVGPELHSRCAIEPRTCVTELPIDSLIETGIRFLLGHDAFSQKLIAQAETGQRRHVLAALAAGRDTNIAEAVKNIRASAAALQEIEGGKPDEYSAIGPILLGRTVTSGQYWQYLKEVCFDHPIVSLCVCLKPVRNTLVIVPATREGKSLIDFLLPPEYLTE